MPDSDTDGDEVADCYDQCPADPTKTVPGVCGCGVTDIDSDGDGIADCVDNCQTVTNPDRKDSNGDGKGDACTEEICGNSVDDDQDGLVDLLDPDCPSSSLIEEKGTLNLDQDAGDDKLSLEVTFAGEADRINPPSEGVTLILSDADGLITQLSFPPGAGWKASGGPKWTFADKAVGKNLSIQFDAKKRVFTLKASAKRTELVDPDVGDITTSITIGGDGFVNTQAWRSTGNGKKLITP